MTRAELMLAGQRLRGLLTAWELDSIEATQGDVRLRCVRGEGMTILREGDDPIPVPEAAFEDRWEVAL